jgi:hypothetical protein
MVALLGMDYRSADPLKPVGMDREAAKQALAGFLAGKMLGANQISSST